METIPRYVVQSMITTTLVITVRDMAMNYCWLVRNKYKFSLLKNHVFFTKQAPYFGTKEPLTIQSLLLAE